MIIGLIGYSGVGKSYMGNRLEKLHGFTQVAFADKVRELVININPWIHIGGEESPVILNDLLEEYGWETAKRKFLDVRETLQDVGHGCRETFGDDFWIKQTLTPELLENENIVITDVRYQNELDAVVKLGGYIARVERTGVGPVNDHISEQPLLYDYLVSNVDGLHTFHFNIDSLVFNLKKII